MVISTVACLLIGWQSSTDYKVISTTCITKKGGRLAWYHGDKHELIAFDATTNPATKATSVFTMQPDGSEKKGITNNSGIPKGFVGQPAWHPDGEHLVIQVENENSQHTRYNHVSWGINNDLWIIRRDDTTAECIYKTKSNHAALHPHFNADGTNTAFFRLLAAQWPLTQAGLMPPGLPRIQKLIL